jgi:hypothetical protein
MRYTFATPPGKAIPKAEMSWIDNLSVRRIIDDMGHQHGKQRWLPSGFYIPKSMEKHHFQWGNPLFRLGRGFNSEL